MQNHSPVVKQLKLETVSPGSISRYWVHIVSSGMAQPILVPVMVARGKEDGPVLGLTAAVHGNELNGLPVIQKVFHLLRVEELRGTLVGVPVVNVPGFLINQRYFNDGADLNRLMPGKANGNISEVYAYRIINKIVRQFEYLIDLHTASFGRINSYYIRADMHDPVTARMARLQNAEIIVNNEGADGTLRSAAADLGIHAITVEAGDPHKFQKGMIRSAITGIANVMSDLDMIDEPIIEPEEPSIFCRHSYWLYTNAGGVLEVFPHITDFVKKDQRIALVRNIYGDVVREYFAPEDGIVVGKSVNPVNQTGSRILHLGIVK
ncbi:MAG: peptidase M14 [Bacteroidetes bacterium]|nr:MAG: peptidase M14 [Bacteroidota bacterium]